MTLSPRLRIAGREVNAFRLCGVVGWITAVGICLALIAAHGGSAGVQLVLVAAAVTTFFGLAALTQRVLGRSALIYYHHEIAVLAVCTAVATMLRAPVLEHLDATALGLGAFLTCGRIGCLHVGCCHGRPARRGIVYGGEHVALGFPGYLTGLKLIPVPAIEAAVVLVLVTAGSGLVVAGAPAGTGVALYVTGYAMARYSLELARGDPGRCWWWGVSEAQWTSLALASLVAVLESTDMLPGPVVVHVLVATALAIAVALQVVGILGRPRGVLDPRHVRELAKVLRDAERDEMAAPAICTTSMGLRVSHGLGGGVEHWSLSPISWASGRALARVVLYLRHPEGDAEVVHGPENIVHIVVAP